LFVSDSQSSYWIKGDICSVRGSVHFRTQRFGLQLRGPGRIRTRSAWSRPVSGSKCKADMHAFGVSNSPIQHSCHSTYELNWTEILTNDCWLVDASSRLRYSHQQATMCVRSILLGHGVTVSSLMCFWMNDLLGHDMTVSTLDGWTVSCSEKEAEDFARINEFNTSSPNKLIPFVRFC
jgi:hypothetical protein